MTRALPTSLMLLWQALAAAGQTAAPEWAVAGAPYRVAVWAAADPGMADAGWEIRLPDFAAARSDMRDVVLLDGAGKEIALDSVWRGPGQTLLVLAQDMPAKENPAMLYFGGQSARRMKSWQAKRSLLLETRKLPPGSRITTQAGWQNAWNRAKVADGAAFVPQIFHGGNPFGEAGHYLSRYTGWLKTGKGGELRFYSLSDDVSHVLIDGRLVLKWLEKGPPPRDPTKIPTASTRVPEAFCRVDYLHAAVDPPGAMALGWERDGKLATIPPEAWVHPGQTGIGTFESADATPVPAASLEAVSYLGFGDHWYFNVKCEVADPGEGWKIEWLWPDGHASGEAAGLRLWMSPEPVRVVLRLRKGARVIEGRRTLPIPREMRAASVNNADQRKEFLDLLDQEDLSRLAEPSLRAGFVLAKAFQAPSAAARWAEAWLAGEKDPAPGLWSAAMLMAIRETGRNDPKAALARLAGLSPEARQALGNGADLLELDLRVFGLIDPLAADLASRLAQSADKELARMAGIRLGDYHLLTGRLDDAVRCLAQATLDPANTDRKAPVLDRSHALAIQNLVEAGLTDEALVRMNAWERQRPLARIEADQLLWRARVMFLAGDAKRALQDLDTSLKVRPGAAEEIELRFWRGRALLELGRNAEAREAWNSLVHDYPKHERAEAARLWAEKS